MMNEAKMSQYQVFSEHFTAIQSAIKASVSEVADKCSEHGIIAKSVHQSVVHGSKTPEERARELLMAVGDQIKTDEEIGEASRKSRFNKFVTILEEDPVHKNLAKCLRDACSYKAVAQISSLTETQQTRPSPQEDAEAQMSKCSEHGIIHKSVHQSIVQGSKTPEEKAQELLIAVGDQIDTDERLCEAPNESHFNKFVNVLEQDPVHINLVRCLRDACSGTPPHSTVSNHPPPSLLPAVVQRVISLPHFLPQAISTDEPSKYFACINRQAITAKFAAFQTKVYEKLMNKEVNVETFRLFVINQFPPGDCFPPSLTSLTDIFEAITHHGLWDYLHFFPLIQIIKTFAVNDTEMEGWVCTYKKDLKAYQIVTRVEDYIETDLVNKVKDDTEVDPPLAKKAKYDPRYNYPVELKLDTNLVDHSLQYVAEVWEMFSCHYLLPDYPPTALLDRVRHGCFSITWLVPTSLIPSLIERIKIDNTFFQQQRILRVTVGDHCIYEEVTEEKTTSEPGELAQQKETQPSKVQLGPDGELHGSSKVADGKEAFGGYEYEFAEPLLNAFQTECPICKLVLHDPYQSQCCGTNFCHSCIHKVKAEEERCPTCRKGNFGVFQNKGLRQSLKKLHVLCPHSKDGCKWKGELGELRDHSNSFHNGDHESDRDSPEIKEQSQQEEDCITDPREKQLQQLADRELAITELQQKEKMIQKLQEANQHLRQELDKLLQPPTQKLTLKWRKCRAAPYRMRLGSATVCGNMAYFRRAFSGQVLSYNSDTQKWSDLPLCGKEYFTLTAVNGFVTAVGGKQLGNCTNTLLSLKGEGGKRKWVEHFPSMPTKRYFTAVVCTEKALVVAGGEGDENKLATVEVMDTDTLKWSTATRLPYPLYDASATVFGNRVYLVGGKNKHGLPIQSVLTCSLSALLQSQTVGSVWNTVADLPVKCSTGIALNGQLLAVGGRDSHEKATNNIYSYNTKRDYWEVISLMRTGRYWCLVAVLPGNKLMVTGGQGNDAEYTDKVEIATCQ